MGSDWFVRRLPAKPIRRLSSIGLGLGIVTAATALRWAIGPWVGHQAPFITYIASVLILSVWAGGWVAMAALVVEAAIAIVFFLPPHLPDGSGWNLTSFLVSGVLMVLVGASLSHALRLRAESEKRLEASERDLRMLVSELGHQAKNGLMVVSAIVSQSARGAETAVELEDLISSRLGAMAKAQDLVLDARGAPIELGDLLQTVLTPYGWERFDRASDPDRIRVGRDVATGLALLTNELATNAVKYGSLTNHHGQVALRWSMASNEALLVWEEQGGQPFQNDREGFGTRLLKTALLTQGGSVEREIAECSLRYLIRFPAESYGDFRSA